MSGRRYVGGRAKTKSAGKPVVEKIYLPPDQEEAERYVTLTRTEATLLRWLASVDSRPHSRGEIPDWLLADFESMPDPVMGKASVIDTKLVEPVAYHKSVVIYGLTHEGRRTLEILRQVRDGLARAAR
jgi:hypothetical protein